MSERLGWPRPAVGRFAGQTRDGDGDGSHGDDGGDRDGWAADTEEPVSVTIVRAGAGGK